MRAVWRWGARARAPSGSTSRARTPFPRGAVVVLVGTTTLGSPQSPAGCFSGRERLRRPRRSRRALPHVRAVRRRGSRVVRVQAGAPSPPRVCACCAVGPGHDARLAAGARLLPLLGERAPSPASPRLPRLLTRFEPNPARSFEPFAPRGRVGERDKEPRARRVRIPRFARRRGAVLALGSEHDAPSRGESSRSSCGPVLRANVAFAICVPRRGHSPRARGFTGLAVAPRPTRQRG